MPNFETSKTKDLVVLFTCADAYDIRAHEDRLPKGAIIRATYSRPTNGDVHGDAFDTNDDRLIDELCVDIHDHLTSSGSLFQEVAAGLADFKNVTTAVALKKIEDMPYKALTLSSAVLLMVARAYGANFPGKDMAELAAKIGDSTLTTLSVIAANAASVDIKDKARALYQERLRAGMRLATMAEYAMSYVDAE